MNEEQLAAEAKRRGITVEELRKLLGSGMAYRGALTLKERKRQLDDGIDKAGG